jgi:hypothetical protein
VTKLIISKEAGQVAVVGESKSNNGDSLSSVKRETSRTFSNKKRKYLKEKINELETKSKYSLYIYIYRERELRK